MDFAFRSIKLLTDWIMLFLKKSCGGHRWLCSGMVTTWIVGFPDPAYLQTASYVSYFLLVCYFLDLLLLVVLVFACLNKTIYFLPSTIIIWYPNPVFTSAYFGLPVELGSSSYAVFSNAPSKLPRVFQPREPPATFISTRSSWIYQRAEWRAGGTCTYPV